MVVVTKKSGQLRLCLDPKDLNDAIQREHYPLPVIEDVATRLAGAKVFTVLDVQQGFWHVELDDESSFLTTFNTPFGRYRFKRIPFVLSSSPEVFQRRMHEVIEGLHGCEVIADDFLVVGYGENMEMGIRDHDRNLRAFLDRCDQRNLHLNVDKIQLRVTEVPFIGHTATANGLKPGPGKIEAIVNMPAPVDAAGVRRLLGMIQYLEKFMPNLSQLTSPLRKLTHTDVEWSWGEEQEKAFERIKQVAASAPLLKYYSVDDEVTLQCDASQNGLGAALLQHGQPVAYASRALLSAETRYAQIEKELLAILFACEKFHLYIYARNNVSIQSDHKALENIFQKPLNNAPAGLQRMLLRLQKYDIRVKYTPGKELYVADTLSRAYLPNESVSASVAAISEASSAENLAMSANRLKKLRTASRNDASLQQVAKLVEKGWPARHEVPDVAMPYYSVRALLTLDNDLLFKDNQLVVPSSMRDEMMDCAHKSHGGIGACLRRMRECIFWPVMSKNMKERISTCEICLTHADSQMKEPIIQHDIGETPWSKIGADLCELHGRMLLVVTDYYSNFISVKRLNSTTTTAVSKQLMKLFSVHGIPKIIMTDNATQFSSFEFKSFTSELDIEHITNSPHYPQSNGKAENAVKEVKRLFSRCRDSGYSEYLALLDFNNTPTQGVGLSPSQRLFGRRCRTSLPVTKKLLKPRYSTEHERNRMTKCKKKQARYCNKSTRQLPELSEGETVRVKCPGEKTWTKGTCVRKVAQRSYDVQAENATYRRNRRQLLASKADSGDELPPERSTSRDRSESESSTSVETYVNDNGVANDNISDVRPDSPDKTFLRRSARIKHQTQRLICEKDL